jgi:hypothetical protein
MGKWKRLVSLMLAVALCLSLLGCVDISGYLPSTQESTESGLTTYRITVRTHSGRYLENIGVRVFADKEKTDLIWYDKTDANGVMTFTADTFDGYVVALENIPDGYAAAGYYPLTDVQTEIVLSIGLQTGVDLNTVRLHAGDTMVNLAVTASDGKEYDLSKLLTSQKAVALCFFDSGSAEDLSILQEAWADCADEVTVLALNPVDADISSYASGLQLPIAACDSAWIGALGLDTYPTMVIVDRYGIISLIHEGRITDPEVYRDVFAFFARNDYEAEVVDKIEDIVGKVLEGTLSNPIIQDGPADLSVMVEPGGMVYYSISRVFDMVLQISSPNVWVRYEGQDYYPENGVLTLPVSVPDPHVSVSLGIGNLGTLNEVFAVQFAYLPGTQGNPYSAALGDLTADLQPGDEDGVFYIYKAEKPGVLLLRCPELTPDGLLPAITTATNRNTSVQVSSVENLIIDELTGECYLRLEVSANDVVILSVGAVPDVSTGEYPAGQFRLHLGYEGDGAPVDPPEPTPPGTKTTYTVTVQDAYGMVLGGVSVIFTDPLNVYTGITDASGTVTYSNTLGSVQVTLVPLPGYTAYKTEFTLKAENNNISVMFSGEPQGEFTTTVVGNAYHVALGDHYAVMNGTAMNYYLFVPAQAGNYQFIAGAQLSYWGNDINAPEDRTWETTPVEGGFQLTVSEEQIGIPVILGMTGAPYATLTIAIVTEPAVPPME